MLIGRIDTATHDYVYGWAYDDERPESAVKIKLYVDGKVISQGIANLYRTDLHVASIGTGYHGFCLPIPIYVRDGSTHHMEIRGVEQEGQIISDGFLDAIIPSQKITRSEFESDELMAQIFDADHYVDQAGPTEKPLDHYRKVGWKLGYDPHVLFSTKYYIENIGRELESDPLSDFCASGTVFWPEVHPLLDVKEYLRIRPDLISHDLHPLTHYLRYGWREAVGAFRVFDSAFYQSQFSCSDDANIGGAIHYLKYGWRTGKRPHPQFDPIIFSRLAMLPNASEPLSHLIHVCLRQKSLSKRIDYKPENVKTSIIVLNLNKSVVTLQCLFFIHNFTDNNHIEIVVLDNGSNGDQFEILVNYGINCNIIRLQNNLGFGEGNNIAAEASRGKNIVFLNNDAFVTSGWLNPLLSKLEDQTVGGVGPIFLYPNGSVQEAGGTIFDDGIVHQRGRGLPAFHANYDQCEEVSYISAATLAVRKNVFLDVLGFDLMWDPAYYEDVDLCLKIQAKGYKIIFEPKSKVVHLEGTTSGDADLRLNNIVATNRLKFVQRWQKTIQNGITPKNLSFDLVKYARASFRDKPVLALFTPYPLQPGGGERYILSIAHVLREEFDCILFMPRSTSRIRLLTMAREFGLNLDHVKCEVWSERGAYNQPDLFFCVGNEIVPPVEAMGKRSFFICQFPFPITPTQLAANWSNDGGYDAVILYSDFVIGSFLREIKKLSLPSKPIHRVYPPVDLISGESTRGDVKRILSVGRFGPDGHCKRQDVMVEVFKEMCRYEDRSIELHLAGSLGADDRARDYFFNLKQMAEGLRIYFHVNISASDLRSLYLKSEIYWHMTGANESFHLSPERFEHFGITIVEAMSAGCIPIVIGCGGPAEIVEDRVSGFHVSGKRELLSSTISIFDMLPQDVAAYRTAAVTRAQRYGYEEFFETLSAAIKS
ncbi:glycosyltransferase [Methylobacterium sp. WL18]|uniref:glycosyltransferase n=1 Tax=Methylobacterium sp. WL18 TaxID=2603897 RepID=UPI0011CBCEA0|nr:glycosyltransferase [Methylobacterium sp. WL18]TXN75944.1 glycosyltransferase [Methylobacterium sp. WL18]